MTFPLGPLTAVAIGDAYGAGFEFLPKGGYEAENTGERYYPHTLSPRLAAGCYSDDTQYALACTHYLLDGQILPGNLSHHMVRAYMHDPRGYSPRMKEALAKAAKTSQSLADTLTEKGDSAGAASRATVFGLFRNEQAVREWAVAQALLTHAGEGVDAAEAAALITYWLTYNTSRHHLPDFLTQAFPQHEEWWRERPQKRVMNKGLPAVQAALFCILEATSLRDLLVRCVNIGGDVDTVAAVALGAAWRCPDLPNDLPRSLWDGLENGMYGRDHLRALELKLLDKFGPALRTT
jgi:ADP-ribosylglycohydrolase